MLLERQKQSFGKILQKKLFLKKSQISQDKNYVGVS